MGFKNEGDIATAAYNFIPLADKVLVSPLGEALETAGDDEASICGAYREYLKEKGRHSGYLELRMDLLTPLFIGGDTVREQEMDFIAPTGTPIIPGSTIRGMVKNLYKIVTLGAMRADEDFTERRLYYRCLMASDKLDEVNGNLKKAYDGRMTTKVGKKAIKNAQPGFLARLRRDGGLEYVIYPMVHGVKYTERIRNFEKSHKGVRSGVKNGMQSNIVWEEKGGKKIAAISSTGRDKALNKKVHYLPLSKIDWLHPVPVDLQVIKAYTEDSNRGAGAVDLLGDEAKRNRWALTGAEAAAASPIKGVDWLVPCHFVRDEEEVTDFGHGTSFRIGYKHTIGDVIRRQQQGDEVVDFTDAVFGKKELWAGRVFFEDGLPEGRLEMAPRDYATTLMGPNPTSFQLYLEQPNKKRSELVHWDNQSARIRGYKLYWHKAIDENGWRQKADSFNAKNEEERRKKGKSLLSKKIQPVKKGVFVSRIRFRELSDEELGALLQVFHLNIENRNVAYRMGMGKSLGMGSVAIGATLYEEEKDAYRTLFGENGWNRGCRKMDEDTVTQYLIKFQEYAKAHDNSVEHTVGELSRMLDWDNTELKNWNGRIASMSGSMVASSDGMRNKFIYRAPLPSIGEVLTNETFKSLPEDDGKKKDNSRKSGAGNQRNTGYGGARKNNRTGGKGNGKKSSKGLSHNNPARSKRGKKQ